MELLPGYQRLIRARHGYVLYNRNDTVIGRLIEAYGEYFESEVDAFRRFLAPGDVALDIGANIGVHTLALAEIVGPSGAVIAFEPQRYVFQGLCANVALNSLTNVHCVNAAVGDVAARLHFADPDPRVPNNFGGAGLDALAAAPHALPVAQLVLDDYLAGWRPRLIKVDVEGMEAAVLRGGQRLIDAARPVLYVENDRADRSGDLIRLLLGFRYRVFWHLAPYLRASNYFGRADRLFPIALVDRGGPLLEPIGVAVNLLCVPAEHALPIAGLREVGDAAEHPFRRDAAGGFALPGGAPVPVVRA